MATPKAVSLLTSNPQKLHEFQQALSLHGVRVTQVNAPEQVDFSQTSLLLRESTQLLDLDRRALETYPHLQPVLNLSRLEVYGPGQYPDQPQAVYEVEVQGYLDLSRLRDPDSFDWDYCFVHTPINNRSNDELRRAGCKYSARQKAIGDFAAEFLRLPRRHAFNFTPLEQAGTVSFQGPELRELLNDNPWLKQAPPLIQQLINWVLASGVFLRTAKNRRERNYWLPGLNAGIPTTPKKDSLHETTFLVHDLMHHLFADLYILTDTPTAKAVYIVQRMMSEAFTLVLADMIFVHGLVQNLQINKQTDPAPDTSVDYDFDKRRIYPLYREILSHQGEPELSGLLWASVRLCLAGDEQPYRELGVSSETLAHFREKYDAFFVRDYQWTLHNAGILLDARKLSAMQAWYTAMQPVLTSFQPPIQTTAALEINLPAVSDPGFFDAVLTHVFKHMLSQLDQARTHISNHTDSRQRAFRKYMAGQSFMYFELGAFYPQILPHAELIRAELQKDALDPEQMQRLREFYAYSLSTLASQNMLVSQDDLETYQEIYPLFLPAYVSYDTPLELSLSDMVTQVKTALT